VVLDFKAPFVQRSMLPPVQAFEPSTQVPQAALVVPVPGTHATPALHVAVVSHWPFWQVCTALELHCLLFSVQTAQYGAPEVGVKHDRPVAHFTVVVLLRSALHVVSVAGVALGLQVTAFAVSHTAQ
jgi:hypothetical protein